MMNEMKSTNNSRNNNTRVLAEGFYAPNDDIKSGFNNNDLIIGGSGTGKTGGYVIPNLLRARGSYIVSDTKNQLYRMFRDDLKKKGYEVKLLDFVHPENSIAYNPLSYIRKTAVSKNNPGGWNNMDFTKLAHALIPTQDTDEPFWDNNARLVVSFLLAFVKERLEEDECNLGSVVAMLPMLQNSDSMGKLERMCSEYPEFQSSRLFNKIRGTTEAEKCWASILGFVDSGLSLFDSAEALNIFGKTEDEMNLRSIGQKKTAVFLNVSDLDRTMDPVVNVFFTQALQQLCAEADESPNGRLSVPVRFYLDDFASNVYIEDFDKIISVIRSRNISVSVILQSIGQLESMYKNGPANTIVNNCDHILYLGGQDMETASYVADRCGKTLETILTMPFNKACVMERGSMGQILNKTVPYRDVPVEEQTGPVRRREAKGKLEETV